MDSSGIKVLMISSDRNLLTPNSAVSVRMKEYGALVGELHIVLLADKMHRLTDKKIGDNVWVYPTNSSSKFFRPIDAARLGKRLVLKNRFVRGMSLVTADSIECGWAGLRIKKKWRLPLEVQFHTDPFSPHFTGFQNWVRKFYLTKVIRGADGIRVVSEELKSRMADFRSEAYVTVLPIYIDKEKIENDSVRFDVHTHYPWHFVILMVCRLEPEKNIPLALNILKLVRERYSDAGLLIVGSGSDEDRLKSIVKKMELEGAVAFAGWQTELASYYKTSNIFLQTSLYEGYGLSLVEAGLSGLPVVTTPVGIAQELEAGRDAYIYPPENPDLFATGIVDLIENNQKREYLRHNLKGKLETKLMTKELYLKEIQNNWLGISKKIR